MKAEFAACGEAACGGIAVVRIPIPTGGDADDRPFCYHHAREPFARTGVEPC